MELDFQFKLPVPLCGTLRHDVIPVLTSNIQARPVLKKFKLHGLLILQVPHRAALPRHCFTYTSEKKKKKNETSKRKVAARQPRVWSAAHRSPSCVPAESRSPPGALASRAPLPPPGEQTNSQSCRTFLHFATLAPFGLLEPGVSRASKGKRILSLVPGGQTGGRGPCRSHRTGSLRSSKPWGCR